MQFDAETILWISREEWEKQILNREQAGILMKELGERLAKTTDEWMDEKRI